MSPPWPPSLVVAASGHALLALVLAGLLLTPAEPILGVHPMLKPFKFAVSIAMLLGSLAWLIPRLDVGPAARAGLAWVMVVTMVVEMAVILLQAARGTTSHFNQATPWDAALWHVMQAAIVVATLVMAGLALTASARPLAGTSPLMAFAWRAGLWILVFSAVSGFRMGAMLSHTVGGPDGGPGAWLTNWSRTLGDLRVSHFVSLHALQVLPVVAWLASWLPASWLQWTVVVGATAATGALAVATLVLALAGRPV